MKPVLFLFLVLLLNDLQAQVTPRLLHTASEKGLVPEGIAVDGRTGRIFLSSIAKRKILVLDSNGRLSDFIREGAEGYGEGLGMKVDAKRGWLWALSNTRNGNTVRSSLHAFDLATGARRQSYGITDTVPHLWNDLDLDENGHLYITDTYYSAIYSVNPEKETLNLWLKDSLLDWPNGIVKGPGLLYVATYKHGVSYIDPATRKITPLPGYRDTAMAFALDGLVYHNGSLYGVYNYTEQPRQSLVQYRLNPAGTAITGETLLDRGAPYFHEPTTAALYGDRLYVLTNSHLALYNANKESTAGKVDQFLPVVVAEYRLK
ncbi:MAG TPA: hypothetical protein VHK69_03480 [Chitinophagaceae bacterium]|jgi:sugar lactone lactonase YvrE|nr:hypothetical protein [Chitinophagaceae bacterium]